MSHNPYWTVASLLVHTLTDTDKSLHSQTRIEHSHVWLHRPLLPVPEYYNKACSQESTGERLRYKKKLKEIAVGETGQTTKLGVFWVSEKKMILSRK